MSVRHLARVQFLVLGHGREARAEVWLTTPEGEQLRYPISELGLLRAIETGVITAASVRRQKAPHEG